MTKRSPAVAATTNVGSKAEEVEDICAVSDALHRLRHVAQDCWCQDAQIEALELLECQDDKAGFASTMRGDQAVHQEGCHRQAKLPPVWSVGASKDGV